MQSDKLKKTGKDSLQTVFDNINNKIKMNVEMGNCVNEELNTDSFFFPVRGDTSLMFIAFAYQGKHL